MVEEKGEPREEELPTSKCKIPSFLGDCKPNEYVDWELMVDQIVSSFDLHGRMVVRLDTLEFCGYALVEMQLRRNIASRKMYGGSSGWKGKEKEKERASREKSPKKGSEVSIGQKDLTPISTSMPPRASSIKGFEYLRKGHIASQYSNRSMMIMKDDGEIGSESSVREVSTSSEFESLSDESHYEGNLLMDLIFVFDISKGSRIHL
ncbi:hypothetical protein CR513_39410, partial [Mucuna pruriens]